MEELVAGSWEQIASLGVKSLSDSISGLASGTSYSFEVAATNADGTVFAAPLTVGAPTLTATAVSKSQINLSWTTVAGATNYVVDEYINGVWTPKVTLNSSSTTFSVTGLQTGITYDFRVGAIDTASTEFSNSESATTK